MREYTVPARVEIADSDDLPGLVERNAVQHPQRVAFRRHTGSRWEDVTSRDFLDEVRAMAKGLIAAGVSPGERVAIMSRTRYEWTLADFAIWSAGAVPVPIYETSSAEQVQWILGDSGAVGVLVENAQHAATVESVRAELPDLKNVWVIDDGAVSALVGSGAGVSDQLLAERRGTLTADSIATIIYTSGTTGRPKGCVLTHRNFLHDAENAVDVLGPVFRAPSATLLFLPLAHVFARTIQIGCVVAGVTMGHTPDVKNLLPDLAAFQPTFVLAVPRVFERIYNGAQAKAAEDGKGSIFDRAASVAIAYSEGLDSGGASLSVKLQHRVFDALVYSKLRERLGGRNKWAVSGGAPLGARLGHFFRGIGLTILEGYGLTETSAATTVNTPDAIRIGSVGRPIPGTSVRVESDGEVLLKGPHIFRGYWNNDAATAESFTDGWFRTGDLGELDADGFLRITGRKKEILVTAGGKNVAPAVLEDRLRAHAIISQCMVVGDGKPFIAALLTLDPEALPGWLASHGKPADMSIEDATKDPDVLAALQSAVDDANKAVSRAEAIKKFSVLTVDFTEEAGQLTPSMKLKRNVVMKEFAGEVEGLYG